MALQKLKGWVKRIGSFLNDIIFVIGGMSQRWDERRAGRRGLGMKKEVFTKMRRRRGLNSFRSVASSVSQFKYLHPVFSFEFQSP